MLIKYNFLPLFFVVIFLVLYFAIYKDLKSSSIRNKLLAPGYKRGEEFAQTPAEFINLFLRPIKTKLLNYTPLETKKNLETNISLSGIKWNLEDILLIKLLLLLFFTISGFFLIHKIDTLNLTVPIILIFAAFGFILPDYFIKRKVRFRKQSIRRQLPSFIDYLLISVEAGLGLDLAIIRVISKMQGPLAEEMANAMAEIKYGKTKRDVFKNLSNKLNIPEFSSFLSSLINGERLGVSLANILSVQGQQIKEKRRQRIQEEAYKIPVKLIFPLVFFILPGLFIVLLGPAAITVFTSIFQ